ncbi:MAG: ATP-binding protein [Chloroflexota bacterium]
MKFSFLYSIRFRLILWFAVILAAILVVFSAFIFFSQARDIRGDARYRLLRKVEVIAEGLHRGAIPQNALQERDIFLLVDFNGNALMSQGLETERDMIELATHATEFLQLDANERKEAGNTWMEERGEDHTHYIFTIAAASSDSLMIIGSPFDPYNLSGRLLVTLSLGSLITLAVALGGGWWLADRAMRPVKTITQTARAISESDLSLRLNLKSRDELGQLANTFDDMLARLQTAFDRQRQFIADASHELRTPLTIVKLQTSRALGAKRTPQEYQRALGVIHSENEFMTHLVNDLLILARIDAGQPVMQKEQLDLSDVALDAVERLSSLAEQNNVRIEVGELPEVSFEGDRQLLLQMLSNLIENGIKHTVGDDRRVKVETGADADMAWVQVTDNGEGIPAGHLPHIFDRFYQVDKARTHDADDHVSGSGLGLAIVQSIAEMHGGVVRVESTPGQGTMFEVRFRKAQGM